MSAFISGGALPAAARGRVVKGYMHVCDYYPTILTLAGGDPTDTHPGVPDVDGFDMWPYLTGKTDKSPRTEIMIGSEHFRQKTGELGGWNGALISGDLKLILGIQSYSFWQSPVYPNATTNHTAETTFDCGDGCLFNITRDPSEYVDLATTMPAELAAMRQLFARRNATMFEARKTADKSAAKCTAYVQGHGGFVGFTVCA